MRRTYLLAAILCLAAISCSADAIPITGNVFAVFDARYGSFSGPDFLLAPISDWTHGPRIGCPVGGVCLPSNFGFFFGPVGNWVVGDAHGTLYPNSTFGFMEVSVFVQSNGFPADDPHNVPVSWYGSAILYDEFRNPIYNILMGGTGLGDYFTLMSPTTYYEYYPRFQLEGTARVSAIVPEPASIVLLVTGCVGLLRRKIKRFAV